MDIKNINKIINLLENMKIDIFYDEEDIHIEDVARVIVFFKRIKDDTIPDIIHSFNSKTWNQAKCYHIETNISSIDFCVCNICKCKFKRYRGSSEEANRIISKAIEYVDSIIMDLYNERLRIDSEIIDVVQVKQILEKLIMFV